MYYEGLINSELILGLNIINGAIIYQAVAESFDMPYVPVSNI